MGMVFGLGSGRSGTKSLADLLNRQAETVCFHEMNPSCMAWAGAEDTITCLLKDFQDILAGGERAVVVDRASPHRTEHLGRLHSLDRVSVIGDVAMYFLPYVEMILERVPDARFPCLKRARHEVVRSYERKLSGRFWGLPKRNHWAPYGNRWWRRDPRWDKCYPTYRNITGWSLAPYVERFYDTYYAEAERLQDKHPHAVRIFALDALNSPEGRDDILRFCQVPDPDAGVSVHSNSGRPQQRRIA